MSPHITHAELVDVALSRTGATVVLTAVVLLAVTTLLRAWGSRRVVVLARIIAVLSAPALAAAAGVIAIRFMELSY